MNILEKEIEDVICSALEEDPKLLYDRGLHLHPHAVYSRQVPLGNYGIADIVGIRVGSDFIGMRTITVTICELKKDQVNAATLLQAVRYGKAVEQLLSNYINTRNTRVEFDFILVGKSVDSQSDFCYLPDVMDNVKIYTYNIDLKKGITFNNVSEYYLTDPGGLENLADHFRGMLKENMKRNHERSRLAENLPF